MPQAHHYTVTCQVQVKVTSDHLSSGELLHADALRKVQDQLRAIPGLKVISAEVKED